MSTKQPRFYWEHCSWTEPYGYSTRGFKIHHGWRVYDRLGVLSPFEVPDAHTAEHVVRALNFKENAAHAARD